MHAVSTAGRHFEISGDGVTNTDTSFLGDRYTAVKRFDGQTYIDANVSTSFVLEIRTDDGTLAERIELDYDTLKCVCAEYDSL